MSPRVQQRISPVPRPSPPPAALPEWEMACVFRETFLVWLTPPGAADAFRYVGNLFFDLMLKADDWPAPEESPVRGELEGATRDLRFLQGYLATIGQAHSGLTPEDARLSRIAEPISREVGELAARIERRLAKGVS
ncbi:MAG TPA: hypothetical protein VF173_14200 [Thermoanaerobaculia bacterium]|nr:hypothetical protein [Thermoanaerobaculia bacterium]